MALGPVAEALWLVWDGVVLAVCVCAPTAAFVFVSGYVQTRSLLWPFLSTLLDQSPQLFGRLLVG